MGVDGVDTSAGGFGRLLLTNRRDCVFRPVRLDHGEQLARDGRRAARLHEKV